MENQPLEGAKSILGNAKEGKEGDNPYFRPQWAKSLGI